MKRASDDFAVLEALENDDMLTDALLDYKKIYGKHAMFEEFFNALEEVIMEQAVAEDKRHNEYGCFSESSSVLHWRELAKGKCSPKASTYTLPYSLHQFTSTHPRRKNSNLFHSRFQVIKKIQTKTKQNDNVDMKHANMNAKNFRKVLVNTFDKKQTMILSYAENM